MEDGIIGVPGVLAPTLVVSVNSQEAELALILLQFMEVPNVLEDTKKPRLADTQILVLVSKLTTECTEEFTV